MTAAEVIFQAQSCLCVRLALVSERISLPPHLKLGDSEEHSYAESHASS